MIRYILIISAGAGEEGEELPRRELTRSVTGGSASPVTLSTWDSRSPCRRSPQTTCPCRRSPQTSFTLSSIPSDDSNGWDKLFSNAPWAIPQGHTGALVFQQPYV